VQKPPLNTMSVDDHAMTKPDVPTMTGVGDGGGATAAAVDRGLTGATTVGGDE
jgi:hypothetical protein